MAPRQSFDDAGAVVGRPVVDDNEFVRWERLRKHAANGLLNPPRSVAERNDCHNRMIKICLCHLNSSRTGESMPAVAKCQGLPNEIGNGSDRRAAGGSSLR